MAMSKRDYEMIAETFHKALNDDKAYPPHIHAWSALARLQASYFKDANPRFRYDTFYAACGLNEWGYPHGSTDEHMNKHGRITEPFDD